MRRHRQKWLRSTLPDCHKQSLISEQLNPERVLVVACGALAHDLVRIRELNDWTHIDFQCLPAEYHNYPEKIPIAVREKIQQNRNKYKNIFIAYSDCGTGGMLDKVIREEGVERLPGAHCYEMFAGQQRFKLLHEAELGTFYLTDFLAQHFDRLIVRGLGLDRFPQLREQYFGNYRKLVYLSQKGDEETELRAEEAAHFLDLEYEKVITGDDFLASALSVKIGTTQDSPN